MLKKPNMLECWMKAIACIAAVISIVHASPVNITLVEQNEEGTDLGECLPHQYFDLTSGTCENCTWCPAGTEHSPPGPCGYGHGNRATCKPCEGSSYQGSEGYSDLKCFTCETCHPGVEIIQNCTVTHNAICGNCLPGTYPYGKNLCLDCKHNEEHEKCVQDSLKHPTLTTAPAPTPSPLDSLPTTPSPSTPAATALPSSSSPEGNTSDDLDGDQGNPARKFSVYDTVILVVGVILVCVILIACCGYKKWKEKYDSSHQPSSKQVVLTDIPTEDTDLTTDNSVTASGSRRPLPPPSDETSRNPEENVALLPEGEPRGPSAQYVVAQHQGAGVPLSEPSASQLPGSVSINELSLPGALSSNGGPSGDIVYVPHSPDSAKDNEVFEYDEDDGADNFSLPGPLMS